MNEEQKPETDKRPVRQRVENYLSEHPDQYVRDFLDKIDASERKWKEDQEKREKELREDPPKEESVFDEPEPKKRGLLTHPINPLSARHPHNKSLTLWQHERIEKYLRAGLSIRDVQRAVKADNFETSYGVIRSIRKKLFENKNGGVDND